MTGSFIARASVVPDTGTRPVSAVETIERGDPFEKRRPQPPGMRDIALRAAEPEAGDTTDMIKALMEHLRGNARMAGIQRVIEVHGDVENSMSLLTWSKGFFTPTSTAYSPDKRLVGKVYSVKNSSAEARRARNPCFDAPMVDLGYFAVIGLQQVQPLLRGWDGYHTNADAIMRRYGIKETDFVLPRSEASAVGVLDGDLLTLRENPFVHSVAAGVPL